MHELSLLENVREILEGHAVSQHFRQVSKVTLEIGKLSCVEPNAVKLSAQGYFMMCVGNRGVESIKPHSIV